MNWYLYPIHWYLTATDWVAANSQKTFWLVVALAVLVIVT
jgi:hypothetical protein